MAVDTESAGASNPDCSQTAPEPSAGYSQHIGRHLRHALLLLGRLHYLIEKIVDSGGGGRGRTGRCGCTCWGLHSQSRALLAADPSGLVWYAHSWAALGYFDGDSSRWRPYWAAEAAGWLQALGGRARGVVRIVKTLERESCGERR